MEDFDALKYEIQNRHAARLLECAESDGADKVLRAQGAFRELEALTAFIENMENPPKEEEK